MSATDFGAISGRIVQFDVGDTSNSLIISITNDDVCETPSENFFVNIALVGGAQNVSLSISRTLVTINDMNEPECGKCKAGHVMYFILFLN